MRKLRGFRVQGSGFSILLVVLALVFSVGVLGCGSSYDVSATNPCWEIGLRTGGVSLFVEAKNTSTSIAGIWRTNDEETWVPPEPVEPVPEPEPE